MNIVIINTSPNEFWRFPKSLLDQITLENKLINITIVTKNSELKSHLANCDYIIAFSFPKILIKKNSNLKEIIFLSSGIPSSFINDNKSTYKVSTLTGINSNSVADHALYLMLKGLRGDLTSNKKTARPLNKQNIGIIGHGAIGKKIHHLTAPLGTTSVVTRQEQSAPSFYNYSQFSQFLQKQNIIFITTALNDETISLFTKERFFDHLNNDCIIINIARGELIDESSLTSFLNSNPKGLYLTDVTHPEPYPPEGVLRNHKQVYITEHVAGTYDGIWDDIGNFLLDKVKMWNQ
jgi:phosphoglycerate dehydrogenase-like enzyme